MFLDRLDDNVPPGQWRGVARGPVGHTDLDPFPRIEAVRRMVAKTAISLFSNEPTAFQLSRIHFQSRRSGGLDAR